MTSTLTTTTAATTVAATVTAARRELEARGIELFAAIDHSAGAASAGLDLADEVLLVFGNPTVGTRVMQDDARAGLDLPLRLLIWDDHGTTRIGYEDPRLLAERFAVAGAGPALEAMAGLLSGLALAIGAEPPSVERSPRAIAESAFHAWMDGTGHVSTIFADEMTWEIVGESQAAGTYSTTRSFEDDVLTPFGRRFSPAAMFKPVRIRNVFADGSTVIVLWDGEGTTTTGSSYANTYAWVMRFEDGLVVDGIAFFDSIAFDRLWNGVEPV
jgi:uncharacterized protein (DUF302 family)/ketosteroid isomerase-like protein